MNSTTGVSQVISASPNVTAALEVALANKRAAPATCSGEVQKNDIACTLSYYVRINDIGHVFEVISIDTSHLGETQSL